MTRSAAIDFGKVRIGLALSDERGILATPLPYLKAGNTLEETVLIIAEALKPWAPLKIIVLGLPLHMSGHESPLSEEVRKLAPLLENALATPVKLWDERLTTSQVTKTLKASGVRRKKQVTCVDSLSAALILQSFLELH